MFYYDLRNTAALFKEWKRSAAPDSLNIFFFTNHDNDNLAAFNGNQRRQKEFGNTRVKEMNECPESPIL